MTDLATARELVTKYLRKTEAEMDADGSALPSHKDRPIHHLIIVGEREYDFGWMFFYDSKEYVESGKIEHALAGNAPLIVDHIDGQLYVTGTAYPMEHYISEYRKGARHRADAGC